MHNLNTEKKGALFIISAPSGAGKTTLVTSLLSRIENVIVSVSHTTRKKRPGEAAEVDYHFLDNNAFLALKEQGIFLEWAQIYDHYYGTSRDWVQAQIKAGLDVILEIDWQGARQIRAIMPECISIFILPPSLMALEERLQNRGQDHVQVIAQRLRGAVNEMEHFNEYNYVIFNDVFQTASDQLLAIIQAERLKVSRQEEKYKQFIANE